MSWRVHLRQDPGLFVEGHDAVRLVTAYFHGDEFVGAYSGRHFDTLGRPGGVDQEPHRFTAADLLSVEMLSVQLPPERSAWLLEGGGGSSAATLLDRIPIDLPIWEGWPDHLDHRSAANELWQHLVGTQGIGPVIASKLMGRKRPHLIPIVDNVITSALRPELRGDWLWHGLADRLADADLRQRLESVCLASRAPQGTSLLRVLDICIWMRNYGYRDASGKLLLDPID